ncbi:hypothetical protein [Streptococcus agalactiae]|uniref:hypothetical protein n=1 Tax=Streptococcus agalactiae TaxID=1311 RepID=UPI00123D2D74|nr:hypothetical protein [Streptococcus agalactiae]KAA9103882.1 hypothetical protein F5W51_04725 [Streptococcus agalactiae]
MKKITTLILASSLLLVATTSVKADDNFEMPTRYVKMSEKSKAFYQRLQEKQRKAHTTARRTHENFLFILLCPDINFEKIPF